MQLLKVGEHEGHTDSVFPSCRAFRAETLLASC
jgi:hypothetical protein